MRSFVFALLVLSPLLVSAGDYNILRRIRNVLKPSRGLEGCTDYCMALTSGNCQHPNIKDDICLPEVGLEGSGICEPGLILCNGTKVPPPAIHTPAPHKEENCKKTQCMTENGMADIEGNMNTICMHNTPHNLECRGYMSGTEVCPNGFIDCQMYRVSATPTRTRSITKSATRTASSTRTASTSSSRTASTSSSASVSPTASASITPTSTSSASFTATASVTASVSPSDSASSSASMTRTVSPSSSATRTPSASTSIEPSVTAQPSESVSAIPSSSPEASTSPAPSNTPAPSTEPLVDEENFVQKPMFNGNRVCVGDDGKDKDKNARLYCNSIGFPNYETYTIENNRQRCCRARETNNLAEDCADEEDDLIDDITCQPAA